MPATTSPPAAGAARPRSPAHGPAAHAGLDALRLLALDEAAGLARVSTKSLRAAIAAGELPARRRGPQGAWRVATGAFFSWLRLDLPVVPSRQPHELLTVGEVVALAGYSAHTVLHEIAAGRLPARRLGRGWRVAVADYVRWAGIAIDARPPKK